MKKLLSVINTDISQELRKNGLGKLYVISPACTYK